MNGDGRGGEWMELEMRITRLEDAVARLAEAQARTEERVTRLEDAVARLAEAQARTEERVEGLAQSVLQLTQQVKQLTQQVGQLAERVGQLAERVGQLAEQVGQLTHQGGQLTQQVGRLAETIGFTLEDLAREVAPAYLAHHHGIQVPQLDRRFFSVDGEEVEVDLYGEGEQDGRAIVVVGEVRSRIYGRDVQGAARRAARLRGQVPGAPVAVLFGFVIHPSARDAARQLDAIVISSSGRPERW
jgi:uncharacterized protein YoxC